MNPIRQTRAWLVFMASGALFGGPPYLTDDPDPVGLHHLEMFFFAQGQWAQGMHSGFLPALEANYGPFSNAQIQLQIPFARADLPEGGRRGLGTCRRDSSTALWRKGDPAPNSQCIHRFWPPPRPGKVGSEAAIGACSFPCGCKKVLDLGRLMAGAAGGGIRASGTAITRCSDGRRSANSVKADRPELKSSIKARPGWANRGPPPTT